MKFLFSIILLFGVATNYAQQAAPLSLAQAIKTGLANNYQIQVAEQNIRIAQNNNTLKATNKYPRVTANLRSNNTGTQLNQPSVPQDILGATMYNLNLTPNVDLSWVLFDGYKAKINKARFEELERLSMGNSQIVVENTINAIILAYWRAVIEVEKIGVFQEVLKLSKDRYDFQVTRRDIGVGNSFNVVQSKDAYWNDSLNLARQEILARTAMRNLNLAMGVEEVKTTYELTDKLELDLQQYELADLKQKMFSNNKTLKNQYVNLQLLKNEVAFAKTNKQPTVGVNAGVNYNLNQFYIKPNNAPDFISASADNFDYYLNFSVTFNLYDAGATQRSIENAFINQKVGELTIEDQKRTLSIQLANQLETYQDQTLVIGLNDEIIKNAKLNLELSEDRYKEGLLTSFDYRTVQLAFLQAALTRLESVYSLKNTETEIIRLTGGLVSE